MPMGFAIRVGCGISTDTVLTAFRKKEAALERRPAKWFPKKLADYLSGFNIPGLNLGFRVFCPRACVRSG